MDRKIDRQKDRWLESQMDRKKVELKDRWIESQMDRKIDGQKNRWIEKQVDRYKSNIRLSNKIRLCKVKDLLFGAFN